MKEYTILAFFSVFVTIAIDKISKINILRKPLFYIFLLIILGFKILVNGYLTAAGIVMYNPAFFMGFRVNSMPLEDFFFGFSMVTLSVVFWEYFLKRQR
jgi:lycopene cyclase domain-containing protein